MPLSATDREELLAVARASLEHGLENGCQINLDSSDFPGALQIVSASFVTLQIEGKLRGCVGGLEPRWPLVQDTARHAFGAGFEDPRFPPLSKNEHARVTIHLSVLSPREPVVFSSEEALIATLRPGIDGLVLHLGENRATFLPSVWDSLPEPLRFFTELKKKARIPSDQIPSKAERYHTESFGE